MVDPLNPMGVTPVNSQSAVNKIQGQEDLIRNQITLSKVHVKDKMFQIENEIQRRLENAKKSFDKVSNRVRSVILNEEEKVKNVFHKTIQFEQKIQTVAIATVQEKQPPQQISPNVVLNPVQVNGFYKVTNHNTLTFYVNTPFPMLNATEQMPIVSGWKVIGLTGVAGLVILTKVSNKEGNVQIGDETYEGIENYVSESYLWSFECQTDTEQDIHGTHGVIGLTLYPPDASS